MNYLSHLYLSGENEEIKIGNFIGDYVKGKSWQQFPTKIQTGILAHRHIDHFTDTHAITKEMKRIFRPEFGKYAGVVLDMVLDHILAKNWQKFHTENLNEYTTNFYQSLEKYKTILPDKIQTFIPKIIQHKRLESYASEEGIHEALDLMGRYTSLPSNANEVLRLIRKHEEMLASNHLLFFDELIAEIENKYQLKIS